MLSVSAHLSFSFIFIVKTRMGDQKKKNFQFESPITKSAKGKIKNKQNTN